MTWLKRTLPVSAFAHMAAALSLLLLPAFSGDTLPEPRREPLTRFVLEAAPILVSPRPLVAVRPGGGRRSQGASPLVPAAREIHALPANPTYDQRTDEVVDDPGLTGLDLGEPGADVGLSGIGDGSGGPAGSGVGTGVAQGPLRPGGDLKPPTKLRHVAPAYPELARRAGVEGVVVLECVIDPSGHVADVKVLRGHPLLEAAAVDAVGRWVYTSTRLNGVPVAVVLTVTVRFTIPR